MLVLTRYEGESILIGDSIRIYIAGLSHNRVRIGIEAPANVRVVREEIADRYSSVEVQVGSNNSGEQG